MFISFSWQDFFTAVSLGVAVYYAIAIPLFYRYEIVNRLQSGSSKNIYSRNEGASSAVHREHSIIGEVHQDRTKDAVRSDVIAAEEINIQGVNSESEIIPTPEPDHDTLLIGGVADLLQDITTLIRQLSEHPCKRKEVQSLIHTLLQRHSHLSGTSFQNAITVYICDEIRDHLQLSFTTAEVLPWWSGKYSTAS